MGVEYSPKDLLLGLDEASSNRIGSPVDNILTYCYHYNPETNTHDLIVARVVQLGRLGHAGASGRIHAGHVPPGLSSTAHDWSGTRARIGDSKKGERITE